MEASLRFEAGTPSEASPDLGVLHEERRPGPARAGPSVTFLYLGRRGSLGRFTFELARAARLESRISASFAISRANEIAPTFRWLGDDLLELDTFTTAASPATVTRFFAARRELLAHLERKRPHAVVTLMPHIWTPLLAPAIRKLGIGYVTVVHDAVPHPGDRTAYLTRWLLREARIADLVVTLSRSVADGLVGRGFVSPQRVLPLFHPDLGYGSVPARRARDPGAPLRLLFFGRILRYKGLPLLTQAVELLRAEGLGVDLGVAGAGDLAPLRGRLAALGAEVINRWIGDAEVGPLLARYDAIALSHIEASQSGVAAAAFGHGMPVVAFPVGGIAEQVVDGRTGVLARGADARSLADAIRRLALEPGLYRRLSAQLAATAEERSMSRFLDQIAAAVARIGGIPSDGGNGGMARSGHSAQ
jgi:glycosyltransferase involved in cell wall biosynthesis